MVVGERAITVKFLEVGEDMLYVIKRIGALRMTGNLRDLPRRQLGVDILRQGEILGLQPADLLGDVRILPAYKSKRPDLNKAGRLY